jgi:hypothetical protein
MAFIMETHRVNYEVGIQFLNITRMKFVIQMIPRTRSNNTAVMVNTDNKEGTMRKQSKPVSFKGRRQNVEIPVQ